MVKDIQKKLEERQLKINKNKSGILSNKGTSLRGGSRPIREGFLMVKSYKYLGFQV